MKNSPHRFKHLRKKAARQINLTDVKLKTKTEKLNSRRKITGVILEQIRPFEDHLKPISEKKAKEMAYSSSYSCNHSVDRYWFGLLLHLAPRRRSI